jgi:hypothetical protein
LGPNETSSSVDGTTSGRASPKIPLEIKKIRKDQTRFLENFDPVQTFLKSTKWIINGTQHFEKM